jgi:hypothetical protein
MQKEFRANAKSPRVTTKGSVEIRLMLDRMLDMWNGGRMKCSPGWETTERRIQKRK